MDGKRLIEKIRLRNILSFGDKGEEITLEPLNIIIGQNASGKSNLIDVIKLLRSLPQEKGLVNFISRNGGVSEWIWKGKKNDNFAEIEIITGGFTEDRYTQKKHSLRYGIKFTEINWKVDVVEEILEEEDKRFDNSTDVIWFFRSYNNKYTLESSSSRRYESGEFPIGESVLSQIRDFTNYYEISYLGAVLTHIQVYSDLIVNRSSDIRNPQVLSLPENFLAEDASNLNLVLKDLENNKKVKEQIIDNLAKFNPKIKNYTFERLAEFIHLFIREEGLEKPISAMRLSDGTLRYLCLLAILCHPEPPPLICIEEPETGLHPDILPTIAELMIEASQRTQLIVTTHSDILVSAFSEIPEAVLVCEKDEDGTHFKRLEKDKLKDWLKEYELGEMWLKGEIGGTRW